MEKNAYSTGSNIPTASHKAEKLQAAVSCQGSCNQFCSVSTDSVPAMRSTRQRWRRADTTSCKNITRNNLFTPPISPVCTRSANKTTSACGTSQRSARISSASMANSALPNLTFAMKYPTATKKRRKIGCLLHFVAQATHPPPPPPRTMRPPDRGGQNSRLNPFQKCYRLRLPILKNA